MGIPFEIEPTELLNHKKPLYLIHSMREESYIPSPGTPKMYRNKSGEALSGFYARVHKIHMEVLKIYGGELYLKYKFPIPKNFFVHEMISWENLLFTIGGSTKTEVEQVIARKKPMGFYSAEKSRLANDIQLLEECKISYAIGETWKNGPYEGVTIGCCIKGKVGEMFDLEEVVYFYDQLMSVDGWDIKMIKERNEKKTIKEQILDLSEYEFPDFLDGWDYANPSGIFGLIKTGLLLGYPIESTYACITGNVN